MDQITMIIEMPRVISGTVKSFEVKVTKDPAGQEDAESKITVSGECKSISVSGDEGVHVGISIVGIDAEGQRSKAVTRDIQLEESPAPVLDIGIVCRRDSVSETADIADTPADENAEKTSTGGEGTGTDEATNTEENTPGSD